MRRRVDGRRRYEPTRLHVVDRDRTRAARRRLPACGTGLRSRISPSPVVHQESAAKAFGRSTRRPSGGPVLNKGRVSGSDRRSRDRPAIDRAERSVARSTRLRVMPTVAAGALRSPSDSVVVRAVRHAGARAGLPISAVPRRSRAGRIANCRYPESNMERIVTKAVIPRPDSERDSSPPRRRCRRRCCPSSTSRPSSTWSRRRSSSGCTTCSRHRRNKNALENHFDRTPNWRMRSRARVTQTPEKVIHPPRSPTCTTCARAIRRGSATRSCGPDACRARAVRRAARRRHHRCPRPAPGEDARGAAARNATVVALLEVDPVRRSICTALRPSWRRRGRRGARSRGSSRSRTRQTRRRTTPDRPLRPPAGDLRRARPHASRARAGRSS